MGAARRVAEAIGGAATRAAKWVGWGVAFLLLYDAALLPVAWLASREPPPALRVPHVVLMALLLVSGLIFIATPAGRPVGRREDVPVWLLYFWPTVVATWLLFLALPVFASLALVLQDNGMAGLVSNDPSRPISRSLMTDFFLWHFLDFIPVLDIPERLNWPPPARYSGSWIGALILIYQAGVFVPLIFLFRHYRALARKERKPSE